MAVFVGSLYIDLGDTCILGGCLYIGGMPVHMLRIGGMYIYQGVVPILGGCTYIVI